MTSSFDITLYDRQGVYKVELVEVPGGSQSLNSMSLGERHYTIHAAENEIVQVLTILKTLYPDAVISSPALVGRVSKVENASIGPLFRRVFEIAVPNSGTDSLKRSEKWVSHERVYLEGLKRRFAEAYLAKVDAGRAGLEGFLLHATYERSTIKDFSSRFKVACEEKNIELFLTLIDHVSEYELMEIILPNEKIVLPLRQNEKPNNFFFSEDSLRELDLYVHNQTVGFSGVITLQDASGTRPYTVASEGIASAASFAIHSIGKVFTGMLALRLLREGKISEEVLNKPIFDEPLTLDPLVLDQLRLPEEVITHLKEKKITLKQLMQHKSGLGDYVDNYRASISEAILGGRDPQKMTKPEDFLRFAEGKIYTLNEHDPNLGDIHYSNLGLLLVGLSLQHLTQRPFNTLLQEYVIEPAQVKSFSARPPTRAQFNSLDPLAGHMCGSPSGGYWMTAQDLCKFGSWCSIQLQDSEFLRLAESYGGEFYSAGEIHHSGGIDSSSAYLSVFPSPGKSGAVVAILSDKKHPGAKEMYDTIRSRLLTSS